MVLDLDLFRPDKGGDPERVRANVRKRFDDEKSVDKIMDLDGQWRKFRWSLDQLNKAKNTISKEYGIRMKQIKSRGDQQKKPESASSSGTDTSPLNLDALLSAIETIDQAVDLDKLKNLGAQVEAQVLQINKEMKTCEEQRDEILKEIGNLIHPDVPVSNDEDENAIINTYGESLQPSDVGLEELLSHVDLIEMIGGMDAVKGSMIAGSRGYFLTGAGVWLQQALIQYALRFIDDSGFQPIYTPFWMDDKIMGQVAQLSQFDDELYKIVSSKGQVKEDDSKESKDNKDVKYLIATSEQPIAALHMNEWVKTSLLPMRYGGFSTCFRQEVGSHGRDTRGIFRVHQFEKIEQFVVAAPSKSWEHFKEMIGNAEKFYQSLDLPYRVVAIVSGALNNAAAMKHDLEAYFPGSKAYRELVSVSNCTDYQSRRLKIRFGETKNQRGQVEYVHMLNGTLCAVTRVICCILENYQTKDGILIPRVLRDYMPQRYREFIPFVKPKPVE